MRSQEDSAGRSREYGAGRRRSREEDGAGRRVPGVSFLFIPTCPDPEVHVLVEWTMLVRNQRCKVPYYNQAWGSSYLIVLGAGVCSCACAHVFGSHKLLSGDISQVPSTLFLSFIGIQGLPSWLGWLVSKHQGSFPSFLNLGSGH